MWKGFCSSFHKWFFMIVARVQSVSQSVQSLSHVWPFSTPWTIAHQASLSITNSRSLLKLMSIALVMPSNHLILCRPLLLLLSIFPNIRVFSNESVLRIQFQFSRSVLPNSLQPHELQHARPPCPSSAPRVYPNPCSLSQWCHSTISSSVLPFSFHLQSFPASGSFQMNQFFESGGQSIGVSAAGSVLSLNIQDWFPLEWTAWISLQSNGLSRVFSNTTVQKHQFFSAQFSSQSNSHIHTWPLEKP